MELHVKDYMGILDIVAYENAMIKNIAHLQDVHPVVKGSLEVPELDVCEPVCAVLQEKKIMVQTTLNPIEILFIRRAIVDVP